MCSYMQASMKHVRVNVKLTSSLVDCAYHCPQNVGDVYAKRIAEHCCISLGDIHNMPTFWVLALFGNFYIFCFHVQTCRHLGRGVRAYFLKSARKGHFRNVWVGGGGFAIFQRSTTHWMVHTNMALHRSSIFIQNHCHRQHSFFQAGLGPH